MASRDTLNKIIANTNKIFAAEAGSIALLNPTRKQIVIQAAVGAGADEVVGLSLPVGQGVVGWVISHQQTALVPDVSSDPRFYHQVDQQIGFQTKSIICAPLRVNEHIVGVIELMNVNPQYLNDEGVKIFTVFADHAALAIENSYLIAETRQWSEHQALLMESPVGLPTDRILDTILNALSQQIVAVLDADFCLVSRWNRPKNQLRIIQTHVRDGLTELAPQLRALSTSPLQWALEGDKFHVLEADQTPSFLPSGANWLKQLSAKALFLFPLRFHGKPIGLVEIGFHAETQYLDQDKLRVAELMIGQAAAAIEHARIHDETARRLAETKVLQEIMLVAASSLDFDQVWRNSIQVVHQTLNINRIAVLIPNPTQTELQLHLATIGFAELDTGTRLSTHKNSLGGCLKIKSRS